MNPPQIAEPPFVMSWRKTLMTLSVIELILGLTLIGVSADLIENWNRFFVAEPPATDDIYAIVIVFACYAYVGIVDSCLCIIDGITGIIGVVTNHYCINKLRLGFCITSLVVDFAFAAFGGYVVFYFVNAPPNEMIRDLSIATLAVCLILAILHIALICCLCCNWRIQILPGQQVQVVVAPANQIVLSKSEKRVAPTQQSGPPIDRKSKVPPMKSQGPPIQKVPSKKHVGTAEPVGSASATSSLSSQGSQGK